MGERRKGRCAGGEKWPKMYAHMNKWIKKLYMWMEQVLPRGREVIGTSRRVRWQWKGAGRCTVCKKCVHRYVNPKIIAVETIPGMGGRGEWGEMWRGWIQVWCIWYIVSTFVNATIHTPHSTIIKKIKRIRILISR
jgi:hypothetical protein